MNISNPSRLRKSALDVSKELPESGTLKPPDPKVCVPANTIPDQNLSSSRLLPSERSIIANHGDNEAASDNEVVDDCLDALDTENGEAREEVFGQEGKGERSQGKQELGMQS